MDPFAARMARSGGVASSVRVGWGSTRRLSALRLAWRTWMTTRSKGATSQASTGGRLTDELKWTLLIGMLVIAITTVLTTAYAYNRELDLRAPIIETCIKHPATVKPFY